MYSIWDENERLRYSVGVVGELRDSWGVYAFAAVISGLVTILIVLFDIPYRGRGKKLSPDIREQYIKPKLTLSSVAFPNNASYLKPDHAFPYAPRSKYRNSLHSSYIIS
jgi:hypothetical protein